MVQTITQRILRGTDGAAGLRPAPGAPAGVAPGAPRPTVLDAECECPDECLRDHDNE